MLPRIPSKIYGREKGRKEKIGKDRKWLEKEKRLEEKGMEKEREGKRRGEGQHSSSCLTLQFNN